MSSRTEEGFWAATAWKAAVLAAARCLGDVHDLGDVVIVTWTGALLCTGSEPGRLTEGLHPRHSPNGGRPAPGHPDRPRRRPEGLEHRSGRRALTGEATIIFKNAVVSGQPAPVVGFNENPSDPPHHLCQGRPGLWRRPDRADRGGSRGRSAGGPRQAAGRAGSGVHQEHCG